MDVNTGNIKHLLIVAIIIAAAIAITYTITTFMGVVVPSFVVVILWILFAAVVGILAIKFLFSVSQD